MPEYRMSFSNDFDNLLTSLKMSESNDAKSEPDVIRRAVALYSVLHKKVAAVEGSKVAILETGPCLPLYSSYFRISQQLVARLSSSTGLTASSCSARKQSVNLRLPSHPFHEGSGPLH